MIMRTDGALYLGILFYFELLILLNLRPNTLSCTQSYHDIELLIFVVMHAFQHPQQSGTLA